MSYPAQAIPASNAQIQAGLNNINPYSAGINILPTTNRSNISISEVGNGFIINAWKSQSNTEHLCRICPRDEDLLEEIAKILLELKLHSTKE